MGCSSLVPRTEGIASIGQPDRWQAELAVTLVDALLGGRLPQTLSAGKNLGRWVGLDRLNSVLSCMYQE